ncbi:MAG: hypothetical protein WDM89_21490 [Rhizomicrobium sp.]
MGTNDLIKELRGTHTPIVVICSPRWACPLPRRGRTALRPSTACSTTFRTRTAWRVIAVRRKSFGFDGKTLIHPSQVGPCNDIFAPSPEEVDGARKIIAAFDLPENKGKGAIKLDGRMVELLHEEIARRTVALADAIEAMA